MLNRMQQAEKDFPEALTHSVDTPCYLINTEVIRRNCEILDSVQQRTGAKILLALKAFAMWSIFPLIRKYLHGVCASGPIEARLGREKFGREVHTCAPAYSERDMHEVITFSDHIVFNSIYQFEKFYPWIKDSGKDIQVGLRVNPGHSEVKVPLYNPCLPGSRFGILAEEVRKSDISEINGLHFHALCEQNSDVLERVVSAFEERFGKYLPQMKWINFGGGHHITKNDYDIDLLCDTITRFRVRHAGVNVYLEPGEAVVLDAGVLVSKVLDIVTNEIDIAILDTSAETHMPDVLAMPYRPEIIGAGKPGEFPNTYRLGGITCLAGDVIGDYSFRKPLKRGDKIVLTDMALYSFVKNTTFNGIRLPSLVLHDPAEKSTRVIREFGYEDYADRLS